MSLPKQVQAIEERNAAIIASATEQSAPRNTEGQPAPANEALQQQPTEGQPATPPEQPSQQKPENWQARYLALQGKYNAEVPRLSAELASAKERIKELEDQLVAAKQQTAGDPMDGTPHGVTKDDLERFDPEMIDLARRIAEATVQAKVAPMQAAVAESEAERKARLQQEAQHAKQQAFLAELTDLVPNWQQLDNDQGFIAFLKGPDEATGRVRQELLQEAVRDIDVLKAARLFLAYSRSTPSQGNPQRPAPLGPSGMVVPAQAGSGRPAQQDGSRVYTRKEIAEEYARASKLALRDPDGAKQIEREIDAAMREGRVR